MNEHITFIGAGNMATSLVGGLLNTDFPKQALSVVEIDQARRQQFAEKFEIASFANADEAITQADTVVLAVKPQVLKSLCQQIAAAVQQSQPLIVSVAAGIRSSDIAQWLGGGNAVVRAMPNTPALYGYGACGLYANELVSAEQRRHAEAILGATGITLWLNQESEMDLVTALSGSGPAYFFRIMESLIKAAVELGLTEQQARLLTLQTALGAAVMGQQSQQDIASLRANVTSPGGTTERGLQVLNENDIDGLFKSVLKAAEQRSIELSQQFSAGD